MSTTLKARLEAEKYLPGTLPILLKEPHIKEVTLQHEIDRQIRMLQACPETGCGKLTSQERKFLNKFESTQS